MPAVMADGIRHMEKVANGLPCRWRSSSDTRAANVIVDANETIVLKFMQRRQVGELVAIELADVIQDESIPEGFVTEM